MFGCVVVWFAVALRVCYVCSTVRRITRLLICVWLPLQLFTVTFDWLPFVCTTPLHVCLPRCCYGYAHGLRVCCVAFTFTILRWFRLHTRTHTRVCVARVTFTVAVGYVHTVYPRLLPRYVDLIVAYVVTRLDLLRFVGRCTLPFTAVHAFVAVTRCFTILLLRLFTLRCCLFTLRLRLPDYPTHTRTQLVCYAVGSPILLHLR